MIDLHTHLLPGVDDGSKSVEQSVSVLQRFADDGVTRVVCTPHVEATKAPLAPYERNLALLRELQGMAPAGIELLSGWEIMLDRPGCDLRAAELRLGSSRAVLVEFPRMRLPPGTTSELERIRDGGVVPVVAHPERYPGCTIAVVREWRAAGAVIQTDATMLLGSGPPTELAKSLLEEGLVDCLASDNHGDRRSQAAARAWLEEIGGEEHAGLLTRVNPERVLDDEPTLPVPPLRLPRGVLFRLRELVLGRK